MGVSVISTNNGEINGIVELAISEIDDIFGGASLGEAILIGAAAGGFVGSFASPAGAAIGAIAGGLIGAALYELP